MTKTQKGACNGLLPYCGIKLAIITIFVFILPMTAWSHHGRRDSYNGHIAHKDGCSYHCHGKQKCGKVFCIEGKCESKKFYNKAGKPHIVQQVKDMSHLPQDIKDRISQCKAKQAVIEFLNTNEDSPVQNFEEFHRLLNSFDDDPNKHSEESLPKYKAKSYKFWSDFNNDCKSTRHELLVEFSLDPVTWTDESQCKVKTGRWICPYSGRQYTYARDVHVDHVISRGEAHISGAAYWSAEKKEVFANDKDNLIVAAGSANMEKGAKDPVKWLPEVEENICAYIARWVYVKKKWGLTMDEEEARVVSEIQSTCPEDPSFDMIGFPNFSETDNTGETAPDQTLLKERDFTVTLKCECLISEKPSSDQSSLSKDRVSDTQEVSATKKGVLNALNKAIKACKDLELANSADIETELTFCSKIDFH